jgi:DNA modification methylase
MLYNGDCLEVMPTLKTNSVDMVLVDLPFGQTLMAWDSVIDLDKMWVELERICKPNANIVFFCTTRFGYELIHSKKKWFRGDIVWEKTNVVGFLSAKKVVLRKHEMVYLFGKPSASGKTYNPQITSGHKTYSVGETYSLQKNVYGKNYGGPPHINDGSRYPTSIQKFAYDKKKVHRTQKPVAMCEWLVKTYSNELDVVMDFTMGSGSTGVACKNTKRNFIGIEMDEEIFKIAKERIEN